MAKEQVTLHLHVGLEELRSVGRKLDLSPESMKRLTSCQTSIVVVLEIETDTGSCALLSTSGNRSSNNI